MSTDRPIVLILKEDGWHVKFNSVNRYPTREVFKTLGEAEGWVKIHHPKSWIWHEIGKRHGDLMSFDEWAENVELLCFIDYDGHGDVLDKDFKVIRESYSPSDFTRKKIRPKGAKYVLWYNK